MEKPKFGHELRLLVASLLSMGVILLWTKFFAPKPPASLTKNGATAQTGPATAGSGANAVSGGANATGGPGPTAMAPSKGTANVSGGAGAAASQAPPAAAKADTQEQAVTVENDLYRVVFSNRGAVVKSWELKKYLDDSKPQKVLDVVHPEAAQATGGWPFALIFNDPQLQTAANDGLYVVTQSPSAGGAKFAGSDPEFSWSNGQLEITKRFHFDNSYVVHVETITKLNGSPVVAGLGWLGGFGDLTVQNPSPIESTSVFYDQNGKLTNIAAKKLDEAEKLAPGVWQTGKDWTGIEDRYFAAVFLPGPGPLPGTLEARYWRDSRNVQVDGKDTQEAVPQIVTATQQTTGLRVYVGPKDYDDLKKMRPPLHSLVNFGFFEIIADPLFHGLKWLHNYIPNWGWAIVVLTLVINMLLFPLRISSYRTTLKMQRVAPEIKQIQDKYKKYSMRDPRKAEMNKEVMAVYSREGINPVGGCFQMFLQMPIWFGLNSMLRSTIEMRHARWFGWITDLSARDPYYALPIAMGLSMYLVSKMTPMTSTDPQQQTMMKVMPIAMAGIFIISPISSGLALYILTSSIVGIGQQYWLNKQHPVKAVVQAPAKKKK
ncbi:MAG TPA: membrane protein insertase YidC [Candidatus Acidoferrum sp.]|nr:membrane protein insertase YidC [Candidatus Acidoferrum sp.]